MTKYVNNSGGILVMPDGREVPPRGEIDVSAEAKKNVAVQQWIDGGALARPKEVEEQDNERREAQEAAANEAEGEGG